MTFTEKEWERIDHLVETLGISIAEAQEMLLEDKAIDKGEKLNELPKELEAGAKKARRAERKPNSTTRTPKEDKEKEILMPLLMGAVGVPATQTKPGEFTFEYNDRKFKVVLSAPRN